MESAIANGKRGDEIDSSSYRAEDRHALVPLLTEELTDYDQKIAVADGCVDICVNTDGRRLAMAVIVIKFVFLSIIKIERMKVIDPPLSYYT